MHKEAIEAISAHLRMGNYGQAKAILLGELPKLAGARQDGATEALVAALANAHINKDNDEVYRLLRDVAVHVPLSPQQKDLMQRFEQAVVEKAFRSAVDVIEAEHPYFISGYVRPKRAADMRLLPDHHISERIGIVIQGPLLAQDDFTLETVRLYRQLFPRHAVIISTWDDQPADLLAQLEEEGAHVLRNAKPVNAGPANVNMQLVSAYNGVRHAVEALGCAWVFKTRADMRLYNPNCFNDMRNLLEQFPAENGRQQQRLVIFSDVLKYMLYAVPDMNMFGTAADMLAYWGVPHDLRSQIPRHASMRDYAREVSGPELHLTRSYLAHIGASMPESLAGHFAALRDYFVVYDRATAEVYWHKYERHLENRYKSYLENKIREEFGFFSWLRLRSHTCPPLMDDRLLDNLYYGNIDADLARLMAAQREGA